VFRKTLEELDSGKFFWDKNKAEQLYWKHHKSLSTFLRSSRMGRDLHPMVYERSVKTTLSGYYASFSSTSHLAELFKKIDKTFWRMTVGNPFLLTTLEYQLDRDRRILQTLE